MNNPNSLPRQGAARRKGLRQHRLHTAAARAVEPLFAVEVLEQRVLLSFAGTLDGSSSVVVGTPYTVTFDSTGTAAVSSVVYFWGDNTSTTVTPSSAIATASHTYTSVGRFAPNAQAHLVGGALSADIPLSLDSTFGAAPPGVPAQPGTVTTSTSVGQDSVYSEVIQPDGSIVTAGVSNGNDFEIARYKPITGQLDPNFGTSGVNSTGTLGGGKADIDFGGGAADLAYAVTLDSSGDIIAVGTSGGKFAICRLTPAGLLDPTFNAGGTTPGITTSSFGSSYTAVATSVVLQPTASGYEIVAAGYAYVPAAGSSIGTSQFAIARYTMAGLPDSTFCSGAGQELLAEAPGNTDHDYAQALVLQPDPNHQTIASDDTYILGGYAADDTASPRTQSFALTRLSNSGGATGFGSSSNWALTNIGTVENSQGSDGSDGSDSCCSSDGCCSSDCCSSCGGPSIDSDYSLLIQPADGDLVASGSSLPISGGAQFAVARYSPNGIVDTSFGTCGVTTTSFAPGSNSYGYAATLETIAGQTKIVVAGTTDGGLYGSGAGHDFALARYNPNGGLDSTFGVGGTIQTDLAEGSDSAQAIALDPTTGDLTAGGSTGTIGSLNFGLAAYLPDNRVHVTLAAPTGVTYTPMSTSSIKLNWPTITGASSWALQRSSNNGVTWTTLPSPGATLAASATSYTDTGLAGGTVYDYALTVNDSAGDPSPTTVIAAATQAVPPANLTATANTNSSITVAWTPGAGDANDFLIESSTDGINFTQIGEVSGGPNSYIAPAAQLTQGITYTYRVRAADANNAGQYSNYSATASARVPQTPPTGLTVAGTTDTTATLTWTAPPGLPPASYSVLRSGQQVGSTAATAFQDTGLSPSTSYTYTVVANDPAGDASPASNAATATTTATVNDNTPPSVPGNLWGAAASDSSVSLSWNASTDNVGVVDYEVDRVTAAGNVMVGQTPGTGVIIGGLNPATSYTFVVKAYDAMNNFSTSAPFQATTGADQTAPTTPTNFIVSANTGSVISLSWTASSDNVGVTWYNVRRAIGPSATPIWTPMGGSGSTSFSDSSVTPGNTYLYEVSAQDAASNASGFAPALTVVAATPASTDTAPNQYIPPDWQNYFYNDLTKALRQRDVMAGVIPPPQAQGWLDNGSDTVIVDGSIQLGGLPIAGNVEFIDRNGNGQYDAGETAWVLSSTQLAEWDPTYQSGDTILAGAAPPVGTQGIGGVYYQDINNNSQLDPGEALLQNVNLIQGVQGQLAYRDLAGNGQWQAGDPIWYDKYGDSQFDAGDTVIYAGSVTLQPGDVGKTNGICYYNAAGMSTWQPSDTLVWVDHTTFRQDFAAFYAGLDAVIPKFGSGGTYPNDLETIGQALVSAGATPTTLAGTLSVVASTTDSSGNPVGVTAVTGLNTDFADDLVGGDSVLLGENWYPVSSSSGSTLYLAQPYFGSAWSGTFKVINWTLIPAASSVPGEPGLSFAYQRGQPTANSVIFPQQFTELQGVINALIIPFGPNRAYTGSREIGL